ncbi:MAG: lysophospholipid acyltransferase family protein [Candidatus Thiodiazotropha sp.]
MSTTTTALLLGLLAGLLLLWLERSCRAAQETDWGGFWLNRLDGLNRLYCRQYQHLPPVTVPLPQSGAAIVVSNHISGLDPLLMIAASRRPLRFMIAREQYQRFGLRWLFRAVGCIPVDRSGNPEKAMRQAFKALREGQVVAMFPHGKIHLDSDPPRKIKAGAARLASITGAPVVPLRISGVRAQGRIFSPLILRGRAVIEILPLLESRDVESGVLNRRIQELLDGVMESSKAGQ